MPVITKITTQKRQGRYNVFLDGQYAFPVSESTLIEFQLMKGQELSDEEVAAIKAGEVTAMANTTALNYLSYQPRSVHEVVTHLREADLPEEAIQTAIQRLKDLNYLDDAQFARLYVNDRRHIGDKGPRVIVQKLREKGVSANTIEDALAEVPDAEWLELGHSVAIKLQRHNRQRSHQESLNRIRQGLAQKGFNADYSSAIMAQLDWDDEEDNEMALLKQQAEKQWRLKRRYTGNERKQKVKQALYRKGFALDQIDAVLNELEE